MSKSYKVSIVAVMTAISVASRILFLAPQIKPFTAIIIFSGVMFGGSVGFMVGVLSIIVSGMFFGMNVVIVFQMLCFGLMGYIAGLLFGKKVKNNFLVALYGFVAVFFVYAPFMNYVSACLFYGRFVQISTFFLYVLAALTMDILHSIFTSLYLLVLFSKPVQSSFMKLKIFQKQ